MATSDDGVPAGSSEETNLQIDRQALARCNEYVDVHFIPTEWRMRDHSQ